jgi:hypothetical protein
MLYPGKAYHILNEGASFTIKYPKCDLPILDLKDETVEIQSPWNEINKTPSNHIFGFNAAAVSQFEPGDVIGVFNTNGYCAGVLAIDNPQAGPLALVAFANDVLSELSDGFEAGEHVSFRVFRSSSNEEFMVDVTYAAQSVNKGIFENHGVSVIEQVEFKSTSVNEIINNNIHMQVWPNPSTGHITIELISDTQLEGDISISAMNGQVVYTGNFDQANSENHLNVDLTSLVSGVYYLRLTSNQYTKTEKIILE